MNAKRRVSNGLPVLLAMRIKVHVSATKYMSDYR